MAELRDSGDLGLLPDVDRGEDGRDEDVEDEEEDEEWWWWEDEDDDEVGLCGLAALNEKVKPDDMIGDEGIGTGGVCWSVEVK